MRFVKSTMIVAFALVLSSNANSQNLTARQIVEKAWWAAKLDGSEMVSTLTIVSPRGQKRERKTASVSKLYDNGQTEKRLIRFLSPADVKGTGLLTFDYEKKDDDIWFFLPSLRKTRRIISSEKSKNFMGSEFTYADITPPSVDDFKYKLIKTDKSDGTDCWEIEIVPKSNTIAEENGFSKRISLFGQKDFVIRQSISYDLIGKLHKKLTAKNIKLIDPQKQRFRPMQMTMVNQQNERSSILDINDIKLRKEIPDKYFTTPFLERF
ncbi:MAG: outer membrane lipoprotein-sorting protein [Pseudomonadota bacterium]